MNIDDILSLYLIDISENVIVNFYKMVACLMQLFRNCINANGFQVLTGINPIDEVSSMNEVSKDTQTSDSDKQNPFLKEINLMISKKESLFTQKQKPEVIPFFINLFLQKYLPEKCNAFSEKHAIVLLNHLCLWLENRKFTTYTVQRLDK